MGLGAATPVQVTALAAEGLNKHASIVSVAVDNTFDAREVFKAQRKLARAQRPRPDDVKAAAAPRRRQIGT